MLGARVAPQGVVEDSLPIPVSLAWNRQSNPHVAFAQGNFFSAWDDERVTFGCQVFGARVSPQGGVLDTAGIQVSCGDTFQAWTALSTDGTNYLLAWVSLHTPLGSSLQGARVRSDGVVLDTTDIFFLSSSTQIGRPTLAYNGQNYLLAFQDQGSAAYYALRISPQGVVLDSLPRLVHRNKKFLDPPAVAADGRNWIVAYADDRDSTTRIRGTRVFVGGQVEDTLGCPIGDSGFVQRNPALAFDGRNYLCTWHDERMMPADPGDIYGAFVDTTGHPVAVAGKDENAPVISERFTVSPNPVRMSCVFQVSPVPREEIALSLYDAIGRRIRTLTSKGAGSLRWDGCDEQGKPLASGVYWAHLAQPNKGKTGTFRRVVVLH